jgi:hypothetical protein
MAAPTATSGRALFISEKTVSRHVSTIFVKLGVHSRAAAVRLAAELGSSAAEASAAFEAGTWPDRPMPRRC